MKTSSTSTSNIWRNKFIGLVALGLCATGYAFQTELPTPIQNDRTPYEILEAGLAFDKSVPAPLFAMSQGDYIGALELAKNDAFSASWLRGYLEGLVRVAVPLEKSESEHFVMFTPPGQKFLADYALPSMENAAAYVEKITKRRPAGKIRVEIYPTKEDFSAASTLSLETLERSGAIGICKFHRLMIMSPQTLPIGYRWLDALSHEYMHLMINELSGSKAELWLHEGTARYFETAYRADPPLFLTPDQKTKLLEALEKKDLVPFARMSPSMVYLKDQEQVSLAFAQVSHAVSLLVKERGVGKFVDFLSSLKTLPFAKAFKLAYGMTPDEFEKWWQGKLAKEPWEKSKGTMSDEVVFTPRSDDAGIGAAAKDQMRLGDKMRRQGLYEGALIEYEKALKTEPDNAILLLKAARAHLALKETDNAVIKLRRAIDKNPNYITPYIELAQWVPPQEAASLLKEANALNPFDPRIHTLLAGIYTALGRPADAAFEEGVSKQLTSK